MKQQTLTEYEEELRKKIYNDCQDWNIPTIIKYVKKEAFENGVCQATYPLAYKKGFQKAKELIKKEIEDKIKSYKEIGGHDLMIYEFKELLKLIDSQEGE